MSYVTTGGPGKEHRANKLPPTRRIREGRKERGGTSPHVLPTYQNPCRWNPSWLRNKLGIRKDPESEWLARDNLETNAIAIKPEAASHAAEQFSWVPLPHSSPLERLFPHVSPQTVHFWVLRKSPLSGPRRDLLLRSLFNRPDFSLLPFLSYIRHHIPTLMLSHYVPVWNVFFPSTCQIQLPFEITNVSIKSFLIIRQPPFSVICLAFIISSTHYNILLYLIWSWHALSWVLSIVPLIYLVSQNYTFMRIINKLWVLPWA